MAFWSLPESCVLAGSEYRLHTDYRDILDILVRLEHGQDDPERAAFVTLHLFFESFGEVPTAAFSAAWDKLVRFIDCRDLEGEGAGVASPALPEPKLIDWEQDFSLIASEVNRVAGFEVRAAEYLHWYTFMGYFRAVGEGPLATVVGIRNKRAKGKKLEGFEQEYYRAHRSEVDFARHYSKEEESEKQRLLERLRA